MNLQNTNEKQRQKQQQKQKRHEGKNKCKNKNKYLDNPSRLIEARAEKHDFLSAFPQWLKPVFIMAAYVTVENAFCPF
jgi:hypothetical protein